MKTRLFYFAIFCSLITSCVTIDPIWVADPPPYSSTTYLRNTLAYPIKVQAYYTTYNTTNFISKGSDSLIAYSEDITLLAGETKCIMSYADPKWVKVFRASDNMLLNDNWGYQENPRSANAGNLNKSISMYTAPDLTGITATTKFHELYTDETFWKSGYIIRDDCFLLEQAYENSPPNSQTVLTNINGAPALFGLNDSKNQLYEDYSNGYAFLNYVWLNPDADCFKIEE